MRGNEEIIERLSNAIFGKVLTVKEQAAADLKEIAEAKAKGTREATKKQNQLDAEKRELDKAINREKEAKRILAETEVEWKEKIALHQSNVLKAQAKWDEWTARRL